MFIYRKILGGRGLETRNLKKKAANSLKTYGPVLRKALLEYDLSPEVNTSTLVPVLE